jgi:hypothetical protein
LKHLGVRGDETGISYALSHVGFHITDLTHYGSCFPRLCVRC